MTLQQPLREAEALSPSDRSILLAYLVYLRDRDKREYVEMRKRLDDKDLLHWLTLDEFVARLDARKEGDQ